jgi:hypothetical protein
MCILAPGEPSLNGYSHKISVFASWFHLKQSFLHIGSVPMAFGRAHCSSCRREFIPFPTYGWIPTYHFALFVTISAPLDRRVDDFQNAVAALCNLPPQDCIIICKGAKLELFRTLASYSLPPEVGRIAARTHYPRTSLYIFTLTCTYATALPYQILPPRIALAYSPNTKRSLGSSYRCSVFALFASQTTRSQGELQPQPDVFLYCRSWLRPDGPAPTLETLPCISADGEERAGIPHDSSTCTLPSLHTAHATYLPSH